MHIFELCDRIRESLSIFLDGDKSLKRLRSFVVGHESGSSLSKDPLTGQEEMLLFSNWVADSLGYINSTRGWCNMILEKNGTDEKAYYAFYELLDNFRGLKNDAL